jgi:RNA polymerase sigma-70 factor (ECF subfamily)
MSRESLPRAQRRDAPDTAVSDLLRAVGAGDQTAFAALYDAVSGRVYGLALRITRNHALAEEVAQDVMVDVWRMAPRFDARRGSGIGWILMIAHRRAVDRVRRTSSSRARDARDAALQPVQEPIDEGIVRDDERREVAMALRGLTDLQRQAIELAYYEGYTYREVAERLEVPEGTAKSRLRDGIRQLRVTLRGDA